MLIFDKWYNAKIFSPLMGGPRYSDFLEKHLRSQTIIGSIYRQCNYVAVLGTTHHIDRDCTYMSQDGSVANATRCTFTSKNAPVGGAIIATVRVTNM